MKKIKKIKQALVQFRGSVLCLYNERVLKPCNMWVAFGSPKGYMPRLPWWHSWLWLFISIMGWDKHFPRPKKTQEERHQDIIARYEERFARDQFRLH